ncbi:GIY-YIG nuclease family protein [Jeotgalibacillus aurantiacus]|uniref:hypothetical protein n=1 Tax=Jeotgalibacillus aurantiacus TaxID=2763266 RepID=UPI001D0A383F|nr:hypothetical protein [Jeotgalibacillus aurantiacus]
MSFWKAIGQIGAALLEEGMKKQAQVQKQNARTLKQYESQLNQAAKSNRMDDPEYANKVQEARRRLEQQKVKAYSGGAVNEQVTVNAAGEVTFGGYTLKQWESRWRRLGNLRDLSTEQLQKYNKDIGIYKAEVNGKVQYIGRAIEHSNGGFRKRLRDYNRNSDSARTHRSGSLMNENADHAQISILVVGNSSEDVQTVKALEKALILKYAPGWNVQFNR